MNDTESQVNNFESTFRPYAMKYFQIHAEQRLKGFQFFVTLATAIGGALMYSLNQSVVGWWPMGLGLILSFLSVVFWMLDIRTRNLVKNGEDALKYLDAQWNLLDKNQKPHSVALFARDEYSRRKHTGFSKIVGYISYRICFQLVFGVFFFIGVGTAGWVFSNKDIVLCIS